MRNGNEDFDLLKEVIGEVEAGKVAGAFSGGSLYIPKKIITAEVYQTIKKEYAGGATYKELSRRYGYSVRHIRKIIHNR